jgi:hypothetical protein
VDAVTENRRVKTSWGRKAEVIMSQFGLSKAGGGMAKGFAVSNNLTTVKVFTYKYANYFENIA